MSLKNTNLSDEFKYLIESGAGEEPLQKFLKQHPEILIRTFNQGSQYQVVFPKFRLATDFVPDFVMIGRRSGSKGTSWDGDLIEIEPAVFAKDSPLFNRRRQSTGNLRIAEAQIDDWKIWMQKYEQTIFVPKAFEQLKAKNAWNDHLEFYSPTVGTHQHMVVWYRIIIGRRKDFSGWGDEYRNLRRKEPGNRMEIVTWDRLLDMTKYLS